jgi:hypothetical protein
MAGRDIGYLGTLIVLPFSLIIAVLVFRFAFGAELPNPIDWLPESWREYIHGKP